MMPTMRRAGMLLSAAALQRGNAVVQSAESNADRQVAGATTGGVTAVSRGAAAATRARPGDGALDAGRLGRSGGSRSVSTAAGLGRSESGPAGGAGGAPMNSNRLLAHATPPIVRIQITAASHCRLRCGMLNFDARGATRPPSDGATTSPWSEREKASMEANRYFGSLLSA
jgi:hypothetical protein